ncbi:helix-turn-helix domain-containing protein [Leifsonia naganoensis]|uniref:Transcriptional regulator with XRE-family HTH domain n=1 Tax=Leifsonia naganoensis TaxID=150025 RepID=A0A853DUG5_9MICO|nr:helix-turn-helix transcriptional regulator [Leifsonia naganoensis]NYK09375.1 transcriptional regulator with XRE-family HTH domain [Leifsonia naganoensis]
MHMDAERLEHIADSLVDSHDKLMEDLVAMRKRHALTQGTVAERMGVSQPTVAAFERYDANPTLSTLRRYALAVGATIEHRVIDECGESDDARAFARVVDNAGWVMSQPFDWEWSSGHVVGASTFV